MKLNKEECKKALYGGLLLGGGGGGTLEKGFVTLEDTFKYTDELEVVNIDELDPDGIIVNVSMVGSPSAKDLKITAEDWKITLDNFSKALGDKKIVGFTSCENGAMSTGNGWVASAVTGIPMVDAPSDGRAHPTGTMGSIGLNLLPDYVTVQAASGGTGSKRVELVTKGGLEASSHLIRQAAAADGGMVAVLRNPATVEYVGKNAAVGAFAQALDLGDAFINCNNDPIRYIDYLKKEYEATEIIKGKVANFGLEAKGGYDLGSVEVVNKEDTCKLTFWNEYMTADLNGKRAGTFPDLICIINGENAMPVASAELEDGMDVYVISIPHKKMILGSGLLQKPLYEEVGELFNTDMVTANEDLFK